MSFHYYSFSNAIVMLVLVSVLKFLRVKKGGDPETPTSFSELNTQQSINCNNILGFLLTSSETTGHTFPLNVMHSNNCIFLRKTFTISFKQKRSVFFHTCIYFLITTCQPILATVQPFIRPPSYGAEEVQTKSWKNDWSE